jgi:hypothetical protein
VRTNTRDWVVLQRFHGRLDRRSGKIYWGFTSELGRVYLCFALSQARSYRVRYRLRLDLGRHAGKLPTAICLIQVDLDSPSASIKCGCLSIRYIWAVVVRRRRDGTGPFVCPVGREAQVERTICPYVAGDRRYAVGDTRSLGFHVLWIGHEHYRFVYACPWRVGHGDQSDRHEHHCCVFLDPSWGRDLCRGWWHAVYAALRLVRVLTTWSILPPHPLSTLARTHPFCLPSSSLSYSQSTRPQDTLVRSVKCTIFSQKPHKLCQFLEMPKDPISHSVL